MVLADDFIDSWTGSVSATTASATASHPGAPAWRSLRDGNWRWVCDGTGDVRYNVRWLAMSRRNASGVIDKMTTG